MWYPRDTRLELLLQRHAINNNLTMFSSLVNKNHFGLCNSCIDDKPKDLCVNCYKKRFRGMKVLVHYKTRPIEIIIIPLISEFSWIFRCHENYATRASTNGSPSSMWHVSILAFKRQLLSVTWASLSVFLSTYWNGSCIDTFAMLSWMVGRSMLVLCPSLAPNLIWHHFMKRKNARNV